MSSAILTNSLATNVNAANPTSNLNANTRIHTRTGGPGDIIGYLYFSRPFPLKATILSAKIKFYTSAMTTGTHTYEFLRLGVAFSVSKVTWNTRPTTFIAGTLSVTKSGVLADKVEWEVDVTTWMQTIANGGPWFGVHIKGTEAVTRYIYADNAPETAYRPRLEVTWSDAPATPYGLSPSGGRAVAISKPVVAASYLDVSGATALQAVQVQLNATDVWTSPTFDSGTVVTAVPELDLSLTAYAGLADGATTFWRVRFQDAAGLWSPWSLATSFKRDDKGTLTLNSPPAGTPTVEDATPPILWALTGETQAAYQVKIEHGNVIDWDSGKQTSAATSVTVPSGKINEPSSTVYTLTLKVWDTKDRVPVANSPAHYEIVRNFTFVPGATAGTTALVATPGDPRPKVSLTWNRATAPDRFNVLRNGKVIAAALDPASVFVSGTSYAWVDNSPSPQRALTYTVQAVVNNIASSTNASAVVTVRSKGIWLREPVSGLELVLTGKEDRDFILSEQAAVLQSIAANANKVAISQSLGGLEGRIEGELHNVYGRTAQAWRDDFLRMRALRVKRFWLTVGDYTFQVVAQNFSYVQRGLPNPVFKVGFDAYQQDSISSVYISPAGDLGGFLTGL